jgi:hypothetical protein
MEYFRVECSICQSKTARCWCGSGAKRKHYKNNCVQYSAGVQETVKVDRQTNVDEI